MKPLEKLALFTAIGIVVLWLVSGAILYPFEQRGTIGDMFGAVNALFSGLALAGIVYALLLQREEIALQRKSLEPRLQVHGVRCAGLEAGRSPVFFVEIRNSGVTPAIDVAISIKVHLLGGTAEYTGGDHVISVPAGGSVEHFTNPVLPFVTRISFLSIRTVNDSRSPAISSTTIQRCPTVINTTQARLRECLGSFHVLLISAELFLLQCTLEQLPISKQM